MVEFSERSSEDVYFDAQCIFKFMTVYTYLTTIHILTGIRSGRGHAIFIKFAQI